MSTAARNWFKKYHMHDMFVAAGSEEATDAFCFYCLRKLHTYRIMTFSINHISGTVRRCWHALQYAVTYWYKCARVWRKYPHAISFALLLQNYPRAITDMALGETPLEKELPWIQYGAIDFLRQHLTPAMRVFEFGSGGSTLFFGSRAQEVISVEHDPQWHVVVANRLQELDRTNVTVFLREPEDIQKNEQELRASDPDCFVSVVPRYRGKMFRSYVSTIKAYADEYFDVVLIDGRARSSCCRYATPKVKPGGIIVFDNTDRAYYARALQELAQLGWQERTFLGPVIGVAGFIQTSVWHKPPQHV